MWKSTELSIKYHPKNLNVRKEKLEKILKTYIFDNFHNYTIQ